MRVVDKKRILQRQSMNHFLMFIHREAKRMEKSTERANKRERESDIMQWWRKLQKWKVKDYKSFLKLFWSDFKQKESELFINLSFSSFS